MLHKIFYNILETKADGNICIKYGIGLEMCSVCLFCVQSAVPKAPSPLTLCKVKSHPLWPKETLREIQDITHTEGSNQANSSFLQDYFTVTVCEVILILFNLMENFRRPWFPWRSSLFGSKMPFTTPCEQWHGPLNKLSFMQDKRGSMQRQEETNKAVVGFR